ncbi:MAG: hypothetical protein P8X57_08460 [Cyclobacteriaceae bacterium]
MSAYILLLLISMLVLFIFNYDMIFSFVGGAGILIIIPFHLFAMFCIFYTLYYNAVTLRSIELNREPDMTEYAVEMILFWIWPIGIWILQPRINAILSNENHAESSH